MSLGQIINVPRRFVEKEWGGTETVILETSRELKDKGYSPKIITTMALSVEKKETISGIKVRRFPYTYTRLGLTRSNRKLLDKRGGNMYSLGLFFSALFTKNVRVIHLHTLGRIGALMRIVARIRNVPYVVSIHGGLLDLPQRQLDELIAPTKKSINWGKILDWIIPSDNLVEEADAVICVGEAEQHKLLKRYPEGNIHFLPNGVDTNYFSSGKRSRFQSELNRRGIETDENDEYILSVGSFYQQKNQCTLVKAFAKLDAGERRKKLVLIGLIYDAQYFLKLNNLVTELQLEDDVIFLTDIAFSNPILVDAYKAAVLFVLPSLYETFGVVVLEAWASGTPVICAPVGGLNSFVEHEKNGLFTNVEDEEVLATDINKLMGHHAMKANLIARASRDVSKFSWKNIANKLAWIYQSI